MYQMTRLYHHAPPAYICPICLGNQGIENEHTLLKQADLVYQDAVVRAYINSFWVGKNEGHVIVVPTEHFENIYDLPPVVGAQIFTVAQTMAAALKQVYGCDGITLRQNNEPASEQHAFHFHLHVFPRYENDDFNSKVLEKARLSEPAERLVYAEKLRTHLAQKKA